VAQRLRRSGLVLGVVAAVAFAGVSPAEGAVRQPTARTLAAYASTIRWFNPRLTWGQAHWVAGEILHWSWAFGVDPRLVVAVIAVESRFRHNAVSRAGAIGFGQLMPRTAAGMGLNARDPRHNIYGTVRYLRRMLMATGGRLDLALAGYNAGLGAVRRHGGIPPFRETREYVARVMALYAHLTSNPGWEVGWVAHGPRTGQ
jgi:soluble lytic murein transglycosylase-like protein